MPNQTTGFVSLVGAGPGDVGLITVRGRDLLAAADVVVYDYLSNPQLWPTPRRPRRSTSARRRRPTR
jgi:siroheme synthase